MDRLINLNILANPANWLIIFFVLYLVALLAKILFEAATGQGNSPLTLPPGL